MKKKQSIQIRGILLVIMSMFSIVASSLNACAQASAGDDGTGEYKIIMTVKGQTLSVTFPEKC